MHPLQMPSQERPFWHSCTPLEDTNYSLTVGNPTSGPRALTVVSGEVVSKYDAFSTKLMPYWKCSTSRQHPCADSKAHLTAWITCHELLQPDVSLPDKQACLLFSQTFPPCYRLHHWQRGTDAVQLYGVVPLSNVQAVHQAQLHSR